MSGARALGVAAALAWVFLALDVGAQWPRVGFVAMAVALVVAIVLRRLVAWLLDALAAPPRWLFLGACALAAAGLSAWAAHRAMRDQPLSIDAGIYLLQARAMAHGHLGVTAPQPFQAFGDRFVLEGPDHALYGIFPPGWPLALSLFVAAGAPMLAGPFVAVLLVLALAALGRAVGEAAGDEDAGERATRVALLLSLTSIGRALETADLLSHAFVAVLAALAVAAALGLARDDGRRTLFRAAGLGVCLGWVVAARLLDGVILLGAVAGVLAWRRPGARALACMTLGAAPLVVLLLVEQHAATGRWLSPTQSLYFQRSDWPADCHRLGFGRDVGCTVEHPGPVSRLGGDGYDLRDAIAVTHERARSLGEDLLGWPPLLLLAFVPLGVFASAVDAVPLAFVLALTLAYALFYYGNAMFFGGRHLFPAAAFVWLLVARGARRLEGRSARGVGAVVVLATAIVAVRGPWAERCAGAADFQAARSDLTATFTKRGIDTGILKTHDLASFASAFDPAGRSERVVVLDDNAGLLELRRVHPTLPVYLSLPGDQVGRLYVGAPAPGVHVELEGEWPTFVVPSGLATRQALQDGASGGQVLLLSHASPGARAELPFEVALPGDYAVRVDVYAGPDEGEYALELDGEALPPVHGFAPSRVKLAGPTTVRTLDARRHVLVARCTGNVDASSDYDLRLDVLEGTPVTTPSP